MGMQARENACLFARKLAKEAGILFCRIENSDRFEVEDTLTHVRLARPFLTTSVIPPLTAAVYLKMHM